MITDISTLIRQKRKEKGLTQKELAEGICAQAVISKLEKGDTTPSVDIFFKLINRLDIDLATVGNIFSLKSSFQSNTVYSKKIKQLLYMRDYDSLDFILSSMDCSIMTEEEILYYQWLVAIAQYMKGKRNVHDTVEQLKKIASRSQKDYHQLYLKIVSAIANIYSHSEQNEKALSYFESILEDYKTNDDFKEKIIFLYGISRSYFIQGNIEKSLTYISSAIDEILSEKSIFLLGDSLLMKAHILEATKLYEEAKKYCHNAIAIFDLEKKDLLKNMAQKLLIEISENE